eukprot:CAMPEP_0114584030 /NCGR_PEP_ID=MMETSP0125-20121206/7745_1 /TAXON_ID=485358 ORGANISM="Aristerostoma sp., Strain ATCC 50986" /NCGR_SAMPLE_ID=MMETSP0125 /ASSEMBLY_ACC=CAM_ASM_000245 /LENGTH=101 /DNA_ID=CAMNT_0001778043 /DNA_START=919 /DNA_END=1224 /DNA_ORIENTATION=-
MTMDDNIGKKRSDKFEESKTGNQGSNLNNHLGLPHDNSPPKLSGFGNMKKRNSVAVPGEVEKHLKDMDRPFSKEKKMIIVEPSSKALKTEQTKESDNLVTL